MIDYKEYITGLDDINQIVDKLDINNAEIDGNLFYNSEGQFGKVVKNEYGYNIVSHYSIGDDDDRIPYDELYEKRDIETAIMMGTMLRI